MSTLKKQPQQPQQPRLPTGVRSSLYPFAPFSSYVVTGATNSGKSTWIRRFLKERIITAPQPTRVVYCYGVYDPNYSKLPSGTELVEGLPTKEELILWSTNEPHLLIVLDDLMKESVENKDVSQIFTRGCHHMNMSCLFVTQNLFAQGKEARAIALNTTYLVLFKNVRDKNQITCLGRQMFPGKKSEFLDAYEDATSPSYGYLIMDTSPNCHESERLRTRVFKTEHPILYVL